MSNDPFYIPVRTCISFSLRNKSIIGYIVMIGLFLGGRSIAATQPTSAPTTMLSQTKADLSTPRAAMQSFFDALEKGRPDVMRQMLYSHDENSERLASAMIQIMAALHSIRLATLEKLGRSAAEEISTPPLFSSDEINSTTRPTVIIEENKATICYGGFRWPFVKIERRWKLEIGEATMFHEYSPLLTERWRYCAVQWQALAKEVRAGKYKTVSGIEAAMKVAKFMSIIESNKKFPHPTTQENRKRAAIQ